MSISSKYKQVTTQHAKRVSQQGAAAAVLIFFVDRDGALGYVSYGRDKALDDAARDVADEVYELMESGEIEIGGLRP